MTRSKRINVAKMTTHMLLWNLRSLENNAIHSPVTVRKSHIERCDEFAPLYRAELRSRKVEIPDLSDDGGWEIALAKALGFSMPHPRKTGRHDPVTKRFIETTQVWDPQQRAYVTQQ